MESDFRDHVPHRGYRAVKVVVTLSLGVLGVLSLLLLLSPAGTAQATPHVRPQQTGSFPEGGTLVGTLSQAEKLLVGDLDRDGWPDVVSGIGFILAWRNSGAPFHSGWIAHNIGWVENAAPQTLVDLDGDGDLDLVTTKWYGQEAIRIWRNDGTPFAGAWFSHEIGSMPTRVQAVATGDVDNDGTLDLVVGLGTGSITSTSPLNSIYVWRYGGVDPFVSTWISARAAVVTYSINALALGDLNNDDRLDIVIGTNRAPSVGTLEDPVPREEWPDVYQLRAFRNDGAPFDGGWTGFDLGRDPTPWTLYHTTAYHGFWGAHIYAVAVADFNNDGYMDIATGEHIEGDFTIGVWKNDGTPFDGELWQLTAVGLGAIGYYLPDRIRSVATADFNDDGFVDLVSGSGQNENCEVNYWENSGVPFSAVITDTHWIRHGVQELGRHILAVVAADLDRDNDPDIVALAAAANWSSNTIHAWENRGGTVEVEVEPDVLPADGVSTAVATATVTDEQGHAVADGTRVVFTATLGTFPTMPYTATTTGGVARATLTAGTRLGTGIVTAMAVGVDAVGRVEVRFIGPPATVTVAVVPDMLPADGVSTAVVTATVADGQGHAVADGTSVVFTATLGTFPTMPYTTTTASGVATATLTAGTAPGMGVVTATAGGATGGAGVRLVDFPTAVTVTVEPSVLPADGVSAAVVTATVADGQGHAVADGTSVVFTATLGTFPTMPYTVTTTGGVATATLTAAAKPGTAVIWGYAGTASGQAKMTFKYLVFLPAVLNRP